MAKSVRKHLRITGETDVDVQARISRFQLALERQGGSIRGIAWAARSDGPLALVEYELELASLPRVPVIPAMDRALASPGLANTRPSSPPPLVH